MQIDAGAGLSSGRVDLRTFWNRATDEATLGLKLGDQGGRDPFHYYLEHSMEYEELDQRTLEDETRHVVSLPQTARARRTQSRRAPRARRGARMATRQAARAADQQWFVQPAYAYSEYGELKWDYFLKVDSLPWDVASVSKSSARQRRTTAPRPSGRRRSARSPGCSRRCRSSISSRARRRRARATARTVASTGW